MRYLPLLPVVIILSLSAFGEESIQFNRDVRPILSDKCYFCHGPDGAKREADLRLDERQSALSANAFIPGKPEQSELVKRIKSHDPDERMPPPASKLEPLSKRDVAILEQWIQEGANYEGHWSFLSLKAIVIPDKQPSLHPMDAIVRAALSKRGLSQQPTADRETLIRRLSFDLTGLPPSPKEIADFVNDSSPGGYERVVDRLLESEAYGERMATDWLDVARYSDSYGFQVDRERDMWAWRDWVVRAFNNNLPFDDFIRFQIAGDLIPNATDDQILATGFNRLHQQEAEGGSVEEEYRVEYVCDRVQTFATAFLGLTFECARCHDHKFDPITQKEYYQLFSMFQNIDEAGLYSYFTRSPPTPTLWLNDVSAKEKLATLGKVVAEMEARQRALKPTLRIAFAEWLKTRDHLSNNANPNLSSTNGFSENEIGRFSFDEVNGDKLANQTKQGKPALLRGENKVVPGKFNNAIEFSGDDPVDLPIGNFARHEPFSISLWLKTPDEKERAVVFHRSRAWTDAASRGYELLMEEGRLKWSLIHFWPGNAISIAAQEKVPLRTWIHVVIASDGSSRAEGLSIFVDGNAANTHLVKDKLTKEITGGGGDNIALGERFRDRGFKDGLIDEFRVFDRQLTPLEVLYFFNEPAAIEILSNSSSEMTERNRELLFDYYLATQSTPWRSQLVELRAARGDYNKAADGTEEIMVMRELSVPKKAFTLIRGEYNQPRDEVFAGTPAFLSPFPSGAPKNRLGLAQWLTEPQHPLTARVTVNRVWQSLFGRGLVRTSEDFGSQGARPLYPDLLDWLASDLIYHQWDMKKLLKVIVSSQTYQQRSVADERIMADDPDNEWLARGPRFRLPAEMIRDNVLSVSGLLNRKIGGPPVNPYEMAESFKPVKTNNDDSVYRRSLYTNWRRTGPPPAMIAFDAPRRQVCTAKRERTDSPLQALVLLNGIQYVEAARVCGEKLHRDNQGDVTRMVENGCRLCLSHSPSAKEMEILGRLYREQLEHFSAHPSDAELLLKIGNAPRDRGIPNPEAAAATILVQALLNHDFCVVKR